MITNKKVNYYIIYLIIVHHIVLLLLLLLSRYDRSYKSIKLQIE